ncbi:ferredoxin [Streptomyces sp. x-80]|jgi:ferredoxin|uniref:ferredoxin n=1 Tax=Streptomyces sp. x-80 TaxID=2789282 RepID=UPI00397EDBCD
MKITIEQDKCVAAGQCVLAAPQVFDQREEDGIVVLEHDRPPRETHEDVRLAAQVCPALAITLDES